MKKFSALLIVITVLFSLAALTSCENQAKKEEFEQAKSHLADTQSELEQIKDDSSKLQAYVANLKGTINDLKVKNQRLIAESKRLEAEIIDLKLELGVLPNGDTSQKLADTAAEAPAEEESADSSEAPKDDNAEQEI